MNHSRDIDHSIAKERQAIALTNQGRLQEAEEIYRQLILVDPGNHIAHANLAALCGMQGRFEELIELLKTALKLRPNFPEAHNSLGNAFKARGDLSAAIVSYNKALQLKPSFPEAYNNLGVALKEQGDLAASIDSYYRALLLKSDYPEAYKNLGNALLRRGDLGAAIQAYKSALKLRSKASDFYSSLGVAFHERGDLDAAKKSHNKALELNPECSEAKYNLALAMLLGDDYKNGWQSYECRFEVNEDTAEFPSSAQCKRWQGEDLATGSRLFVVAEQGLGDILQFVRYVPLLRNHGVNVSLCTPLRLHPLIQASGLDSFPQSSEQVSQIDEGLWVPLLSIPGHLGVSPANPIIVEPYLRATNDLNGKWRTIFSQRRKPVVGINWRGNRDDVAKQHRNVSVQLFKKITAVDVADFLCLQRGTRSSDVEQVMPGLASNVHHKEVLRLADSDLPKDFLEYAAVIANCDLVITTGSTVAHLAAAMGIPTWVLLPKIPDWRWGLEGDASFWYPSMRLFRQKVRGDWSEVMDEVVDALRNSVGIE